MASNSSSEEEYALIVLHSENLLEEIQEAASVAEAVDKVRTTLRVGKEQSLGFIQIINYAAWSAFDKGNLALSRQLVESVSQTEWSKSTRRLLRKLCGETSSTSDFDVGWTLIREGKIQEGVGYILRAKDKSRGRCMAVGDHLLKLGYPRLAVQVIEPILDEGVVIGKSGLLLDGLNLLARAARLDRSLCDKLQAEVRKEKESGRLPPEYAERVLFLYETGTLFKSGTYKSKKIVRKPGGDRLALQDGTRQKVLQSSIRNGLERLPPLGSTGETKKVFCELIEKGDIVQACSLIAKNRGSSLPKVIDLYEMSIWRAIKYDAYDIDTLEKVAEQCPNSIRLLKIILEKAIEGSTFERALGIFLKHGRSDPGVARAAGQWFLHLGKFNDSFVPAAAEAILETGSVQVGLEMLKPSLLHYLNNLRRGRKLPKQTLQIFARCAATDESIRDDFLEQVRGYRLRYDIEEDFLIQIVTIAMGGDVNAASQVVRCPIETTQESDEEFIGRISRSQFFSDPHRMLRAEPVDIVAARVSGNSQKKGS